MIRSDFADRIERVLVAPQAPIAEAISRLDRAGTGALLLCEADRKLYGILTDGDIRRAILRRVPFDRPCGTIASRDPVIASLDAPEAEMLRLMDDFDVNHLPLVDADGQIAGLLLRSDLVTLSRPPLSAVIMAGGYGTRLLPLTEHVPKPMLLVGNRPLLELIIEQLRRAGIHRVNITTHYRSEMITNHFGDGHAFGVELHYVTEELPLGTAGGLKLMEDFDGPLLVVNGDILTGVNFRDMLDYHRMHGADVTVGVRPYDLQLPYGVVECSGPYIRDLREKPQLSFLVNAGIYLLEPSVYRYIPNGQRFDMTDLIRQLLQEGRPVVSFPIVEYWLDIGQHADYEQAQEDIKNVRL
jgi:dTDP-glucose pyrophosphorylase/CBS domain-containing protein